MRSLHFLVVRLTKLHRRDMASAQASSSDVNLMVLSSQKPFAEVDTVRSYLRDIGRVPLLSNEQEITLGRQVQELMVLEGLEAEI